MVRRTMARLVALGSLAALAVPGSVAVSSAASAEVESGRAVFAANCAMCHGADAGGMMGMHPSLRGAVERLTVEGVEVTIRNGRGTRPPMPAFDDRLDDAEIGQVIAYIDSLPAGPRNFGPESEGGGMMDGMGGGAMSGWMWLVPVLVLVAIAVGVGALVSSLRSRGGASSGTTPREILDRRYAAGELTREEYLQRRDDLDAT